MEKQVNKGLGERSKGTKQEKCRCRGGDRSQLFGIAEPILNEDRSGLPHTPFTADFLKVLPTGIGHAVCEHNWMEL